MDDTIEVEGGRVTTLALESNSPVSSVEILSQPDHGHVSVNPDNTLALVMTGSDYSGALSLSYRVTYENGSSEVDTLDLSVSPVAHEAGWGVGEHYMLEVDENDDTVVEIGDTHRPVYISGSDDALSRADIAALEGLNESDITRAWLMAHPEYGGSEGMALDEDAGMDVWYGITWPDQEPASHWLLFERGYEYENHGQIIFRGASGEDALHPLHVTSWGEGDLPVLADYVRVFQADSHHVVFTDVAFTGGIAAFNGSNMLFDDVNVTEEMMVAQGYDNFTVRNSELEDVVKDAPDPNLGFWAPHAHRAGGFYGADNEGLLFEGNFVHHNGWTEGYDGTPEGGQPPSMFSHNVYIQNDTTGVTFRDNILAQGASYGAQLRGGGFIEDNAFIDNNAALASAGGIYLDDGPIGNFAYYGDNLITSGAHKEAEAIGGLTLGLTDGGSLTTLIDNLVAHLADPNNPQEQIDKTWGHHALAVEDDAYYNDTIVYNWVGQWHLNFNYGQDYRDENTDGLDPNVMNATTIQNYAVAVLGDADATITDLMDHISDLAHTAADDSFTADQIIDWFQAGFGIEANATDTFNSHRFIPDDLADGVRWDNRLNWDTEVLPGEGDDVDLGGNRVEFGTKTIAVGEMGLGENGGLRATSGKLTVEEISTGDAGGVIEIDNAGQIWSGGYSGDAELEIDLMSGRFVNTGTMDGLMDIEITDGEFVFGTDDDTFDLLYNSELEIVGDEAKVGFDGENGGTAVLRVGDEGTLSFSAEDGDLGSIGEFRTGALGDAPDVLSGINVGGGTLQLDLTGFTETGTHELMEADEIIGAFESIEVSGLFDSHNLAIEVDYLNDAISLSLSDGGSGDISLTYVGDQGDAQAVADLWAALTDGHGTWDDTMATNVYDEDRLVETFDV